MKGALLAPLICKLVSLPSLLGYLYSLLVVLLGSFVNYFFRAEEGDEVSSDEFDQKEDGIRLFQEEDDSPKLFFSFKFQTYREDSSGYVRPDECNVSERICEEESDACFQKSDLVIGELQGAGESLGDQRNEFDVMLDEEVEKVVGESNGSIVKSQVYERHEFEEGTEEHEFDLPGKSEIEEEVKVPVIVEEETEEHESDQAGKTGIEEIEEEEKETVIVDEETVESEIEEEEEPALEQEIIKESEIEEEKEPALEQDIIKESEIEEVIETKENAPETRERWIDLGNEITALNSDIFTPENALRADVAEDFDPFESDEESGDILWEQEEFMEHLKMETKKSKAAGLPTIEEEDEYPNEHEVYSPWKINESSLVEDQISELRKFYRIYRQRMRKLDILNFQKRIAFGCLQSKMVNENTNGRRAHSIRGRRVSDSDSVRNSVSEEFEFIYVAHTCLSWEMLHWQYIKMVEVWETDKSRIRNYNEAAKEYQQFQVLLERFVENEAFEGPRVENYTNKRCSSQKLLQIPVVREDRSKERMTGEDSIKSDQLIEMLEGAIRTMWRFIKADTSGQGSSVSDDPSVAEIRSVLAKKEKRFKEVMKSGSKWMARNRQVENREDVAYFFVEVEMKLVSRVLRMSKVTREQVEWCKSKVDNIDFVGKKMCSQSSLCFFPC